jgi:hypothetical protein
VKRLGDLGDGTMTEAEEAALPRRRTSDGVRSDAKLERVGSATRVQMEGRWSLAVA